MIGQDSDTGGVTRTLKVIGSLGLFTNGIKDGVDELSPPPCNLYAMMSVTCQCASEMRLIVNCSQQAR